MDRRADNVFITLVSMALGAIVTYALVAPSPALEPRPPRPEITHSIMSVETVLPQSALRTIVVRPDLHCYVLTHKGEPVEMDCERR